MGGSSRLSRLPAPGCAVLSPLDKAREQENKEPQLHSSLLQDNPHLRLANAPLHAWYRRGTKKEQNRLFKHLLDLTAKGRYAAVFQFKNPVQTLQTFVIHKNQTPLKLLILLLL